MVEFEEMARGLQESLKLVLARLETGELEGSRAMRHRLEGALVAVGVLLGEDSGESLGLDL